MKVTKCRGYAVEEMVNSQWITMEDEYCELYINHVEKTAYINGIAVHYDSIGQYTGLIDKNGTEIYYGDIIKRYKDSIILGKKTKIEFYQKIIYSEKYAQYLLEDNNGSQEHATWATAGEVIGNIYEHKHLLDKIT